MAGRDGTINVDRETKLTAELAGTRRQEVIWVQVPGAGR